MSQDNKVQSNTTTSGQCPVIHGGNTEVHGGPMAWWPNALNLDILHQHDKKTDPMDPDFDYAKAFSELDLEAVKQDIQGPVNLGTGRPTSFNKLAELVTDIAGYSPEIKHIYNAPEGVAYRVCDPSKMLSFYKPKVSLEEGIHRSLYI